jgi:hypothetical protein
VFDRANVEITHLGANNLTTSVSQGSSPNVGHTIPYFASPTSSLPAIEKMSAQEVASTLASARAFVSLDNGSAIMAPCAFTIEPQLIVSGYPKVGFHFIVVFGPHGKHVISEYDKVFDVFNMKEWL